MDVPAGIVFGQSSESGRGAFMISGDPGNEDMTLIVNGTSDDEPVAVPKGTVVVGVAWQSTGRGYETALFAGPAAFVLIPQNLRDGESFADVIRESRRPWLVRSLPEGAFLQPEYAGSPGSPGEFDQFVESLGPLKPGTIVSVAGTRGISG